MSVFEDMFKGGGIAGGLAIGVGIALLAPVIRPLLRPVAKSAMKAGLVAYEQGKVAFAELNEQAGDVLAEARSELDQERPTDGAKQPGKPHSREAATAS